MKSENEITAIGTSEVEVIKHHIYEVRGMRLRSQFVTSSSESIDNDNNTYLKPQNATSSSESTNIENNTQFAVKNFDRKTDLWSRLNNIVL